MRNLFQKFTVKTILALLFIAFTLHPSPFTRNALAASKGKGPAAYIQYSSSGAKIFPSASLGTGFSISLEEYFGGVEKIWRAVSDYLCPPAYAASKGKGPVAYWRFDEGGGATAYDNWWTDITRLEDDKKSLLGDINGRVFCLFGAQDKLLVQIPKELLSQRLAFPLFFTSVFRVHYDTGKDKHNTQNTYGYSPYKRKFFKEITGQTHYKNCFSNVSYGLGYKFNFLFNRFAHPLQLYHSLKYVSRHVSVLCGKRRSSLKREVNHETQLGKARPCQRGGDLDELKAFISS